MGNHGRSPAGITGQEFSETIHYNDLRSGVPAAASALYGGGISSVEMRYGDSTERSYNYAYDRLGRLTSAVYGEGGETITGYGTSYSYDVMGNMLSLSRYGDISAGTKGPVDNLTMTYDGNRLVSVQDAAQAVTMSGSRAKQGLFAREGPFGQHSRAKQRLSAREGLSEQHSRAKQRLFAREGPSGQHSRAKQRLSAREGPFGQHSRAKQRLSAREGPSEQHSRAKQRLSAREGPSEQHSRAKQGLFAREGLSEQHSRAKQRLFARDGQSERQGSLSESWRYLPDGTKLSLSLSDGASQSATQSRPRAKQSLFGHPQKNNSVTVHETV